VRYFFLKLGPGNAYARPLLQEGALGPPTAVGFFRSVTVADIESHLDGERARFSYQAIDLYRWSHGMLPGYAVTVAAGRVWILEPAGPMEDGDPETFAQRVGPCPHDDDIPKLVPVRIAAEEHLGHVPTLLAQITSNRHLSSSTFKEIRDDYGNRMALDHVVFKRGLVDHYATIADGTRDLYHLLLCLGANELIALVARLLEEHGLSVPAPTGGFVKNVDLFVYNDRSRPVTVGSPAFGVLEVPPRRAFRHGAVMLQVRGAATDTRPEPSPEVDYLVQLNAEPAERVLDHAWIGETLRSAPNTRRWLARILRWVPFSGTVIRALRSASTD
tara:strand:- start:859 stop:1848 length:990 start_codon:yes stop_codon:yes gene_type:complete